MGTVIGAFIALPGMALLYLSIANLFEVRAIFKRGYSTIATVIEIKISPFTYDDGGVTEQPILRFDTEKGETITVKGASKSSPYWNVGDETEVVYDPKKPGRARENTSSALYENSWWMLGFGIFLTVFGFAMASAKEIAVGGVSDAPRMIIYVGLTQELSINT